MSKFRFIVFFIVFISLGRPDFCRANETHNWTWRLGDYIRAEINLSKGILTFSLTNLSTSTQSVNKLLFNEEYLKETINIELPSNTKRHGETYDKFRLREDGLLGINNGFFAVTGEPTVKIEPNKTKTIKFNLIDAPKHIKNPILASHLSGDTVRFFLRMPIYLYMVGGARRVAL